MRLSELLDGMPLPDGMEDVNIERICSDSRRAGGKNELFVALKGAKFDGHDCVSELSEKGVAAFVTERDCGVVNQIIVDNSRLVLSRLWARFYGNPERRMRFIGVTGTNGKTTTTTLIKNILSSLGHKCGLIGTCGNEIGNDHIEAERTTPEPEEFFSLLRRMADAGCEYVVMEVSSQGLCQYRLGDVYFDAAVFTNLTQDHLDVHGTMENYYQAKKLLFSRCKCASVNMDDSYGRRLLSELNVPKYSFSIHDSSADYCADAVTLSENGTEFWYSTPRKAFKVSTKLVGGYNVENCLAALSALELCGINANDCVAKLAFIEGVRGRLETVPTGRDFTVVLDYAHTPDALENALSTIKKLAVGRVVCVFGCGGNRDAKKRPLMAKAAARYADFLVVTSDNPRDEDPHTIITEIITGLDGESTPYIEIDDRRDAIFWAVGNALSNDIIVLAGKGQEDYQILADGHKIHFDEREVVAEALAQLDQNY